MDIINLALKEDIGSGDLSGNLLPNKNINAIVICKSEAIIYGKDTFDKCFDNIKIKWVVNDGEQVEAGKIICKLSGNNREILKKERVALNFLQTLSGISTQVFTLSQKIKHTNTKILDTRKTIPGMRDLQKKAVVCGGGVNHRFGLYDSVMIKENHITAFGSLTDVVRAAQIKYPKNIKIIVEVENLVQLQEADRLGVSRILCDNFDVKTLSQAVKIAKTSLEASGSITEKNIVTYAQTGVDFISIGSMTKNIQAIDLSMLIS